MRYWAEGMNKAFHTRRIIAGDLEGRCTTSGGSPTSTASRPLRMNVPHLNTYIWLAENSAMIVMAEDKKALFLLEGIRELHEKKHGVKTQQPVAQTQLNI